MATIIREAAERQFMSKDERKWKARLIRMLEDDGKGHHHKIFAKRLADFDLNIIDAAKDPNFTASMSFDEGKIRISSGFLTGNIDIFRQLSVLLRHEMAHNLMMHQIRMMHKIEEKYGEYSSRISMSLSLHNLINIIEDFEISNTRYTAEDKITVRNMYLNGTLIGGLVTEDHRNWTNLSVIEMYEKLEEEIDKINDRIILNWNNTDWQGKPVKHLIYDNGDVIKSQINYAIKDYKAVEKPTNFFCSLDDFIANKGIYHFAPLDGQIVPGIPAMLVFSNLDGSGIWQDIIVNINNNLAGSSATKNDIKKIILEIGQSGPTKPVDIVSPITGEVIITVVTPEEKTIANDALKAILPTLELYHTWYDKVNRVLSDTKYTDADRQNILAALLQKGS